MLQIPKINIGQRIKKSNIHSSDLNSTEEIHFDELITDPLTAFQMFLRPIEYIILDMTNLYGVRKYKDHWQNIDLVTLHAYFDLLLLAGVHRSYDEYLKPL